MKKRLGKRFWITLLIITALVVLITSASVVSAIAKNVASPTKESSSPSAESKDEQKFSAQLYNAVHNRSRWLYDLLNTSGKAAVTDSGNARAVFEKARSCGVIGSYTEEEMYQPLDRLFIAQTTVKALGYKQRSAGRLTDITAQQNEMSTMAYYGYFLPDVNGMVYPDKRISADEYDSLLVELNRYRVLKGKRLLSFGDSIMYGTGTDGEGVADMLAEKYGMTAHDYSVPGATMGILEDADHIRDQVARAVTFREQADIILLNGCTNDMNHETPLGGITNGFDKQLAEEGTFTGGFEKTLWMLRQQWKDVPIVYFRAHNMNTCPDTRERLYGERSLVIAKKWSVTAVDLYTDTEMNTEDASICARYTYLSPFEGNMPDAVHPNAAGYARFYLPLISEAVERQFIKE